MPICFDGVGAAMCCASCIYSGAIVYQAYATCTPIQFGDTNAPRLLPLKTIFGGGDGVACWPPTQSRSPVCLLLVRFFFLSTSPGSSVQCGGPSLWRRGLGPLPEEGKQERQSQLPESDVLLDFGDFPYFSHKHVGPFLVHRFFAEDLSFSASLNMLM